MSALRAAPNSSAFQTGMIDYAPCRTIEEAKNMFRRYSQNRRVTKLISVALSVFVYVLMLPVVSSAPRVNRALAKPALRTQQGQQPLVPDIPPIPAGSAYRQTNFVTPSAVASCPAAFIFASITGNIIGWNPSADPNSTTGVIAASHSGRVFTGLANGSNSGGKRLYAADFANGNIDVYDGTYALTTTTGGFADPTVPTTAGNTFHPFNIQNIGGSLYVMYAKVGKILDSPSLVRLEFRRSPKSCAKPPVIVRVLIYERSRRPNLIKECE